MSLTSFVKVAGLWQLDRLPTLCFTFGEDADVLRSSYLIDDNAIAEHYESTATMDMAELAITVQSKTGLCMSDFFVVNRGKGYWAVDIRDPSISYAFGPSTKTRTITKLANGFATIRGLIDEEQRQQLQGDEGHASQSSSLKLGDINGEEVVVGERFVLRMVDDLDYDEDEDPEGEKLTMFDGWGWVSIFNQTLFDIGREVSVVGEMDDGACFGLAIVDGVTYITFEGQFMQIEDRDSLPGLVILPSVPSKRNRVHISYFDGGYIALSRWGAEEPVVYEWLKARCGVFTVYNVGDPFHISDSAKLRIVKV
ncbi:hypothetical protein GGH95_002568 [Coemansia sp. RSA 1836]|nr:hypothetical protein GGH95_002568 [Coemansia sp. RSA 1836]